MSRPIHGKSTAALKFLRKEPAALAVYWCYVARSNIDGVAWPSGDGLARDTGWDKATCLKGRSLLVELKALELVEKYIRPQWRGLTGKPLAQKLNLDRSEYYRPTAVITVKGVTYNLLYVGAHDENDIDNFTHGVPRPPSMASHMQPDTPELALSSSELGSNKNTVAPKNGATDSAPATTDDPAYADFLSRIEAITSPVPQPRRKLTFQDNPDVDRAKELRGEVVVDEPEPTDFDLLVKAVERTLKQFGAAAEVYAKMLSGMACKKGFNEYRMDEPVSATELQDWALWYERNNPRMNPKTTPMKLQSSILEYRAQKANGTSGGFDHQSAFTFVEG